MSFFFESSNQTSKSSPYWTGLQHTQGCDPHVTNTNTVSVPLRHVLTTVGKRVINCKGTNPWKLFWNAENPRRRLSWAYRSSEFLLFFFSFLTRTYSNIFLGIHWASCVFPFLLRFVALPIKTLADKKTRIECTTEIKLRN